MSNHAIVFADVLARQLGVSEDEVYAIAQEGRVPFGICSARPRRLFCGADEVEIWERVVRERAA